ncbi:receptor-type tyrosine-protein phosphatase eta-like isoform X37 [Puntigrus tetrazona]|uniref:receptor-type tyrosine-protein phosphatase eta-like isoform X37 n=1 Tax=Puntigrus tetrazona TaxID=1606681 RepID=UPI001C8902B2|nr:receptor-type tyrosine-protein phosphatase eta-like isoform X37 [Puntigrus tetrazona]
MARLSFKTVCKGTALLLFFIILGLNAQSNTDITSLPVTLSITSTEENTSSQALSTTTAPATTSSPSTESQTSVSTTAPVTTSSLLNETQTSSPTSIFIHGHLTASVTTSSPSTESQTSASTTAPVTTSSLLTTTQTSSPTTAPVTTSSLLTTTQTSTSTTAPVTTSSLLTTTQTSSPTTASVTTSSSSTESQTSASTTAPVTTSSLLTTTQTSSPTTASVTTSSSSTESQTSASTTATATTSSPSTLQSQTSSPTTATATTSSPSTVQSQTSASTTAPVTTNSLLTTTQTSTPTTAPVTTSSLLTTTQTSTPTTASVTTSSPSTLQSQTSASTTAPVTTNSLLTTTQTSTPTTPVTTSSLLTTTQTSSPTTTATTSSPSTFQSESSASTTPVTTSSLLTTTQTSSPTTPANTSSLSPESKKSASTAATASTSSPSTKSQTSATTSSSKTESNTWLIVGIVLAVIFFFFIIILTLFFCSRRQTKKQCPDILAHTISNNISIALRIEDYEEYFKQKHKDSNCGFAEEYEELKTVGTAQSKNTALAIENKPKNRYGNVLPYDVSRVKLSMCGSLLDDYINANYIPGYNSRKEFIAAQGPLPVTVNEFWRMVWEKNVHTIVMLTRCNEMGRVKCEKYWPSGTNHYENFSVTTTSEIELESWTIRDFTIKNVKTAETRYIRQFHFTAWPDHGVPQTTEVLIDFRHLVREHMDQYSRHSPAVVHCSAGVGRTGTFIAIDHLIFQIERDSMVDIYGIVNDMRMHRPLMVQTEEQYVYLHQSAYDIIRSRTGSNMDLIYQNAIELSVYQNVQYQKL